MHFAIHLLKTTLGYLILKVFMISRGVSAGRNPTDTLTGECRHQQGEGYHQKCSGANESAAGAAVFDFIFGIVEKLKVFLVV